MRMIRWILVAGLIGGSACFVQAASASTGTAPLTASEVLYGPANPSVEPGGSAPLADQIVAAVSSESLSSDFGGANVLPDGTVNVYATPGGTAALQNALNSLGSAADGQYTITPATTSLYQLESDTLTIQNSGSVADYQSSSAPFEVVSWGPDSTSGTVQFSVIGDTGQAQSALSALFPSIPISVIASKALGLPTPVSTNRYYDSAPWSSGDRIDVVGHSGGCTQNFAYTGNKSGNTYDFTARHCDGNGSGSDVTNDGNHVGNIATAYNDQEDFASYGCNCQARVWYEGESIGHGQGETHGVIGWCDCFKGNDVTMDGATSGEQPDFAVQWSAPGCVNGTCGTEFAQNYNAVGCQGGDSGGPVYQRTSNNDVYATGLLLYANDGGSDCYYQTTRTILNAADVSMMTG